MTQLESTISNLTPATTARLTGTAVVAADDSTAITVKATLAQLRTMMFAGSTGYTATDPLMVGGDIGSNAAALATNAVTPFLWVPSMAGTPSGTPSASMGGAVPMVFDTTNSKLYARIASAWAGVAIGGATAVAQFAVLNGTSPVTMTTGNTYYTVPITAETLDTSNIVTLASSQFTLAAGSYVIIAGDVFNLIAAVGVGGQYNHTFRLRNITGSSTLATNQLYMTHAGFTGLNDINNLLMTGVTLSGSTTYELQHMCTSTISVSNSDISATYGQVVIIKVA